MIPIIGLYMLFGVSLLMVALYVTRWRNHDAGIWSAPGAWSRWAIYCCACIWFAYFSGALAATLSSPLVSQGQLQDPWWLLSTLVLFAFIVAAYWIYWYRNTLRFGRRLDLLPQLVFGLGWGFCTGLLFLSWWHVALRFGETWPLWGVWLLAYTLISVWQAFWMDMYWDVYVSPEHDTPDSIRQKVPRTHIPNMTLCLTWFAIYENYWLFIALQTLALLAAAFGMRMPAPWSRESTPAARRVPGLLGLPRAGGYLDEGKKRSVQVDV